MSWSKAKEDFLNALNSSREHAKRLQSKKTGSLFAGNLAQDGNNRLQALKGGEKFLSNLEEIKRFCPKIDEQYFIDFLNTATLAIKHPQSPKFHNALATACRNLFADLSATNEDSRKRVPVSSKAIIRKKLEMASSDAERAILIAAALTVITCIAFLASGPWGLIAVAAAATLSMFLVSLISIGQISEYREFLKNTQYDIVSNFVGQLGSIAYPEEIYKNNDEPDLKNENIFPT